MPLSAVDMREIELVINSDNSAVGLGGDVYEVERNRGGTHGSIMKYDLNQLNSSTHLEEICTRLVFYYGWGQKCDEADRKMTTKEQN